MVNTVLKRAAKAKGSLFTEGKRLFTAENRKTLTAAFIAFLLPGARIFGGLSPFCPAFLVLAVPRGKIRGGMVFLPAVLRYFLLYRPILALKYILPIGIFYFVCYVARGGALAHKGAGWCFLEGKKRAAMLVLFLAALVFLGGVLFGRTVITPSYLAHLLLESLLIVTFYFLFLPAAKRILLASARAPLSTGELFGGLALICALLSGISDLARGALLLHRVAAVFFIIVFASLGDFTVAVPFGLMIGMFAAFSDKSALPLVMGYALPAFLSATVAQKNRILSIAAFGATAVFCILYFAMTPAGVLWAVEIVIAGALALAFPQDWAVKLSDFVSPGRETAQGGRTHQAVAQKIALFSSAMREIYGQISQQPRKTDNVRDPGFIYEKTANKVCKGCPSNIRCWVEEYGDTMESLKKLSKALKNAPAPESEPSWFTRRCLKSREFLDELKKNDAVYSKRREEKERERLQKLEVSKQYISLADSLSEAAQEIAQKIEFDEAAGKKIAETLALNGLLVRSASVVKEEGNRKKAEARVAPPVRLRGREEELLEKIGAATGMKLEAIEIETGREESILTFVERKPIQTRVGSAMRVREGERIGGDNLCHFRTADGKYVLFLSDGMGSGEQAAADSSLACATVKKILRPGLKTDMALRALNAVFMLKEREEAVTTLDFAVIDLESGECELIKAGAAPTFIKSGGDVLKVTGRSVPAGVLDKLYFDKNNVRLSGNNIIVMLSDGMMPDGADEVIVDSMLSFVEDDPEKLCELIMDRVERLEGAQRDDRSILVCILEKDA